MRHTVLACLMALSTLAPAAAQTAGTFVCTGETRSITVVAPAAAGAPMTVVMDGSDTVFEATVFDMILEVQVLIVDVISGTAVQLQLAGAPEATLTTRAMGGDPVDEPVVCDDHEGLVAAVRAAAE